MTWIFYISCSKLKKKVSNVYLILAVQIKNKIIYGKYLREVRQEF